jgi:hypothetical protein
MRTHCARCRRTRLHHPKRRGRPRRYCRACRLYLTVFRHDEARRKRRARAKELGVPYWKRNGWKTHAESKAYHRRYLKQYRAAARLRAAA